MEAVRLVVTNIAFVLSSFSLYIYFYNIRTFRSHGCTSK